MNRRKEACHCRNVTYDMIEDAVRSGADTLQVGFNGLVAEVDLLLQFWIFEAFPGKKIDAVRVGRSRSGRVDVVKAGRFPIAELFSVTLSALFMRYIYQKIIAPLGHDGVK